MDNKYLALLEKMSVPQLQKEAHSQRQQEPEKAAAVYSHLIDRVDDFNDKLYYQRLAARFESMTLEREAV